jgi:hypothetical protein
MGGDARRNPSGLISQTLKVVGVAKTSKSPRRHVGSQRQARQVGASSDCCIWRGTSIVSLIAMQHDSLLALQAVGEDDEHGGLDLEWFIREPALTVQRMVARESVRWRLLDSRCGFVRITVVSIPPPPIRSPLRLIDDCHWGERSHARSQEIHSGGKLTCSPRDRLHGGVRGEYRRQEESGRLIRVSTLVGFPVDASVPDPRQQQQLYGKRPAPRRGTLTTEDRLTAFVAAGLLRPGRRFCSALLQPLWHHFSSCLKPGWTI